MKLVFLCLFMFLFINLIANAQTNIITQINIEPEYTNIKPGQDIIVQITLLQLGDKERKDVIVKSYIKDLKNKNIALEEQTIALEAQSSLLSKLNVPKDTEPGNYEILVEIRDPKNNILLSEASQGFFVEKESFLDRIEINKLYLFGFYSILIVFVILIILLYLHNKKLEKHIEDHHKQPLKI